MVVVESPVGGSVSLNGGKGYPIGANRALKWDGLQVGTYTVRVSASNGRVWQDSVEVREGGTVTARASGLVPPPATPVTPRVPPPPEPAYLDFYVYPRTASVFVDGRPVRAKKIQVTTGAPHAIKVEADGYIDYYGTYTVVDGESKTVSIRLERDEKPKKKSSVTPMW